MKISVATWFHPSLGVKLVGIYAYTCNSVTKKIELRNINIIKIINLE